jgi:hypothetical protein
MRAVLTLTLLLLGTAALGQAGAFGTAALAQTGGSSGGSSGGASSGGASSGGVSSGGVSGGGVSGGISGSAPATSLSSPGNTGSSQPPVAAPPPLSPNISPTQAAPPNSPAVGQSRVDPSPTQASPLPSPVPEPSVSSGTRPATGVQGGRSGPSATGQNAQTTPADRAAERERDKRAERLRASEERVRRLVRDICTGCSSAGEGRRTATASRVNPIAVLNER